jgi:hypothetical protein
MPIARSRIKYALAVVLAALSCLRLSFLKLLWSDEDYHLAAAINILHGKVPYRDFWYDKPPLAALYYLGTGGFPGAWLRVWDAAYVLAACWLAYRIAREWWGEREGWVAAGLIALLIVPHLAAVYLALRGQAMWAGLACGVGLLVSVKAVFVLASCVVWVYPSVALLLAGCAGPGAAMGLWLWATGAAGSFYEQVWAWGLLYARGSPVAHPIAMGLSRVAHWLGFHGALALGGGFGLASAARSDRVKLSIWIGFSFLAVCFGNHFAPRYFLQLLPPLAITAARGVVVAIDGYGERFKWALTLLLLVPLVRFGPRYVMLASDALSGQEPQWADAALDLDSQIAAGAIERLRRPDDTLFVWGYRPDLYVYTRMISDSRFWDSQPLTGVPADRHLSETGAIENGPAARNRVELSRSKPTFVVDGLGLLNPQLQMARYSELRDWLRNYREAARTKLCVIYRRIDGK